MSDKRPDKVQIFESLVEITDPAERSRLLDEYCGADAELRGEVEDLLARDAKLESFLDREQANTRETSENENSNESTTIELGSTIGRYKIVSEVGEGGMGSVWLAEQEEPVKRRVALKLIKSGIGSKEVIARFESERQALALMNHPNIARILDAGTTEDGRPFFAMELVQGLPLTTYCDRNRLGINERLKLFAEVCAGVQHAHQKGILHRDLKPSNILVAQIDSKPVPKVIDFGLAKALESTQRLTDQSLFTGIGQILGTLKYMSPEQAALDMVDIDTRTDIYSLGVILYELLTGSTPLDDDTVRNQALLKVLELIREKEPVRASSRLQNTGKSLPKITEQRRTDSSSLNRILVGDLDWVVAKALEKDRARRYESASGLAADLQRFLNDEPVEARPPSLNYRFRKFVHKNRAVVVAAALLGASLLIGIAGTSWGLLRANVAKSDAMKAWSEESERANGEKLAKEQAQLQRDSANRRFDLAINAIESFYSGVSYEFIVSTPESKELRLRLLKQPEKFFEQLKTELRDNQTIDGQVQLAAAYFGLYKIQRDLNDSLAESIRNLETAIELLERVVNSDAANNRSLELMVKCEWFRNFEFLKANKRLSDPPMLHYRSADNAIRCAERLVSIAPENHLAKSLKMRAHLQKSRLLEIADTAGARDYLDTAASVAKSINLSLISNKLDRMETAQIIQDIGFPSLVKFSQFDSAEELLSKSIAFFEDEYSNNPNSSNAIDALAESVDRRLMIRRTKDPGYNALEEYKKIFELRKKLVQLEPNNLIVKFLFGRVAYSLARRYFEEKNLAEARDAVAIAATELKEVIAADPSRINAIIMLQLVEQLRGDVLLDLGEFEEAIVAMEAVGKIENYHGTGEDSSCKYKVIYANAKLGRFDDIDNLSLDNVEIKDPVSLIFLARAIGVYLGSDEVSETSKYQENAISLLERTLARPLSERLMNQLLTLLRTNSDFDTLRELDSFNSFLKQVPIRIEAEQINNNVWGKAKAPYRGGLVQSNLVQMRAMVEQNPVGMYFNTLAVAEYRFGNFEQAKVAALKSIEWRTSETGLQGPHPSDLAILAMSHFQIGDSEDAHRYRIQLDEAMKLNLFKQSDVCLNFQSEVNDLFGLEHERK